MRAHFGLPSVESEDLEAKRPITVNFEIPYFTVSGIQVGPFIHTHHTVLLLVFFIYNFDNALLDIHTWVHCRVNANG